ncbi:Rrf2 family transcriptional regulator [Sedimentibacter hydroxybenzoicus DSM 7310]|uniref:Rrf2 family transcriptional regulator n=1 Tax=Sedimentibacter hydroxybenzoicus DSM 7310 TaxID=1123245 RepID=A0A974BML4_SEDHY|nr:Rrf2 family transcriptional regulator [Sedimentibacter hydroxybenzoicus]NYB75948.1 Rrf2 family transcriptional regulator [Sedimentibacter hydroxybenzoicus DSM 7310]
MILSTKGRYGLKAIFELALNYGSGPVSLKKIAEKYDISESYLEQLFAKLRKGGYIDTVRGPQGGYFLARKPDEITVGMILRTLEGDITTSECISKEVCSRESICATRVILEKIENSINNVIDNITLADMYEERKTNLIDLTEEKDEQEILS